MVSDKASAHRCRERCKKNNEQPWYDSEKGSQQNEKESERGNNSPWCKVQDLRFLPTALFHLRLMLAAAQSNMPLCWRGRAMGTCFLLFSWPRHWLGMLSWAGGGYSNILSDANDPLMMQREKNLCARWGFAAFFVHFFPEDLLFCQITLLLHFKRNKKLCSFSTLRGCWNPFTITQRDHSITSYSNCNFMNH